MNSKKKEKNQNIKVFVRVRSVEEENSRIRDDFRKEFSKKVTNLQENVANFVTTTSTHFNEMIRTIDGSLQKRNSDLTILSEGMVHLVNTLTNILQTWSKQSSQETVAGQQNIQKLLQDARSTTDIETNAIHNFLTEMFLPFAQNHQHQIHRLKAENEGFSRLVNEQASRNSEDLLTFTRAQLEDLRQFKQTQLVHLQNLDQISEKMNKNLKKRSEVFEKYNEKLYAHYHRISEMVKEAELMHQEYLLEDKSVHSEIGGDVKLIHQNTVKIGLVTNAALETEERRIRDLQANVDVQCEETSAMVKGFLERTSGVTNGIEECHDELETIVRKTVSTTEEAWAKQYNFLEQQIRHISQNIRDVEKHHQEHTQMLSECLHKSARSHEGHLEEQRMGYSTFVRDSILSLEQQRTYTSEWGLNVDDYIQECNNDVEQLLTELFQQDVTTGFTPQRREYNYPTPPVTTPSRIMGKLQKINEVAVFREIIDQGIPESSEESSDNRDTNLSDTRLNNGRSSPISTHSIEDISEAARTQFLGSDRFARRPQFENNRLLRNNLRVSRSSEDVNKENSAPTDNQDMEKILKSVSLNDVKGTPRKALNEKK